eukprot:15324423-Ditylum_brightwellii.AAC.1
MQAWSTQDLREYITEKLSWKNNTSDLVKWKLSSNLCINKGSQKVLYHKICTQDTTFPCACINNHPTKTCKCCQATNETPQHFLPCHANKEAWAEFYTSMLPNLNKCKIDPALRILLHM